MKNLLHNFLINNTAQALLNGEGGVATLENNGNDSIINAIISFIVSLIENSIEFTYKLFMKLCIIVGRFVLNVVDFFFVFVRQFLGIEADYTSLESLTDDKIFDFIFNDTVLKIIKYVIIIGLILIILFSIIALLRAEYGNISSGETSKKQVLVSALKSCFLMVIVPLLFIFSIICSNAVLSAIYMATAGGDNISIGTQIWRSSTYQANAYRAYANDDLRIPITFNFTRTNDDGSSMNMDSINIDGTVADMEDSLIAFKSQSSFMKGVTTYYMFVTEAFYGIDQIENAERIVQATDPESHSAYYSNFDKNLEYKRVEYYVMADAIDYCLIMNDKVQSGFFFKSINEVYENHCQVYGTDTVTDLPIEKGVVDGVSGYITRVRYSNESEDTVYFSPEGTQDESDGTVYTLCYSQLITTTTPTGEQIEQEILMPFINQGEFGFNSNYLSNVGSLVIAKGIFDDESHPTAIRTNDIGEIEFYRDDIYVPSQLDFFPTITYELPEGQKEAFVSWFLRQGFEIVTGLDSDQLLPRFYFNFDLFAIFSKVQSTIAKLEAGNFTVDYNMTDKNLATYNLYYESNINPIILLFGSVILLQTLFVITFGLIGRIFDMVVLAVTYPGVVSAIPIDGGKMLSNWTENFFNRLICVYGITIALNFVLLIMPIIWDMQVFTTDEIAESLNMSLIFAGWTADFVNLLINIMFTLVAFSLIRTFSNRLNFMLSNTTLDDAKKIAKKKKKPLDAIIEEEGSELGINTMGENMWEDVKKSVKVTGAVVSGSIVLDAALGQKKGGKRDFSTSVMGRLSDYIPGKAVVTVAKDFVGNSKYHKALDAHANARGELSKDMKNNVHELKDLDKVTKNFKNNLKGK